VLSKRMVSRRIARSLEAAARARDFLRPQTAWRVGCLTVLAVLGLDGMGLSAQPNPPARLHVQLSAKTARVGDRISATVGLRDAYNVPTPAPRPYSVAIEVLAKSSDPPLHRAVATIEKGHRSVVSRVELTRPGVWLVRASHPKLREAAAFISVSNGAAHHLRCTPTAPASRTSVVHAARWHLLRVLQPAPTSGPVLTMRYGHEGTKLTANGGDPDTINAFLSEPVAEPIEVHLWASSGWLEPNPMVIPAGEVVARSPSELRTNQSGQTRIRVETVTPAGIVTSVEGREARAYFSVPIKALRVWCSPSEVPLGSQTEVNVQLLGLESEPISPDEDKDIEISFDRQGVLHPEALTLRKGDLSVKAQFLPQWTGSFLFTASTFGASTQTPSRLEAIWPWPTIAMLVVGGLVGGGIRASRARRFALRVVDVLTGPVVALVAYLAVVYGVIPRLGSFVSHPFFGFFVAVLAGLAGAVVLDRLAEALFTSLERIPRPSSEEGSV
jgi:hypothetical protein